MSLTIGSKDNGRDLEVGNCQTQVGNLRPGQEKTPSHRDLQRESALSTNTTCNVWAGVWPASVQMYCVIIARGIPPKLSADGAGVGNHSLFQCRWTCSAYSSISPELTNGFPCPNRATRGPSCASLRSDRLFCASSWLNMYGGSEKLVLKPGNLLIQRKLAIASPQIKTWKQTG